MQFSRRPMQVGEGQKGMRQREQAKHEQAIDGRHSYVFGPRGACLFPRCRTSTTLAARPLPRSFSPGSGHESSFPHGRYYGRTDGRGRCTTTAATNAGTNKRRGKQGRGFRKAEGGDSNLEIGKWRRRCVAIQSMEIYLGQISPCPENDNMLSCTGM